MRFVKRVLVLIGIMLPLVTVAACGSSLSIQTGSPPSTVTPITTATSGGTGNISIIIHAQEASIDPFSKAPINVSCDPTAHEQLIGGGFALAIADSHFHVMESYPSNIDTWTVYPRNATTTIQQATAYSICARNAPLLRRYIVTGSPMNYNASSTGLPFATALCGPDIGTSGGYYFSTAGHDGPNNLSPDGAITQIAIHTDPSGFVTSDHAWDFSGEYQPEVASATGSTDMTPVVYCVGAEHVSTTDEFSISRGVRNGYHYCHIGFRMCCWLSSHWRFFWAGCSQSLERVAMGRTGPQLLTNAAHALGSLGAWNINDTGNEVRCHLRNVFLTDGLSSELWSNRGGLQSTPGDTRAKGDSDGEYRVSLLVCRKVHEARILPDPLCFLFVVVQGCAAA